MNCMCGHFTPLADGRSHRYSGLTAEKLADVTTTLEDVQQDLSGIIDYNTILIGHSLECDLRVLKVSNVD